MAVGARFQKLRRDLLSYYHGGSILRGAGGAKFSDGARLSFLLTCYFCSGIVINYSYHYVYSKMILEQYSPMLNLCSIRFFYILGDCKFI